MMEYILIYVYKLRRRFIRFWLNATAAHAQPQKKKNKKELKRCISVIQDNYHQSCNVKSLQNEQNNIFVSFALF